MEIKVKNALYGTQNYFHGLANVNFQMYQVCLEQGD